MVEIRFGENYQEVDLAGKTVAEVREQYKEQFGIPDKAQVKLGGKGIKKKLEAETRLNAGDKIIFAEKSRKGLVFIGTILLALSITGGVFAYGATTATVGLTLTDKPDFAGVVAATPPTWNVFGSYKGKVTAGDLFTITPDAAWTGDMSVVLTLANAHDMVEAYRILVLKIEVWDDGTVAKAAGSTTEYLTLGVGEIGIEFDQTTGPTYTVKIIDGFYITHKGGWTSGKEDPTILAQVLQRSAP